MAMTPKTTSVLVVLTPIEKEVVSEDEGIGDDGRAPAPVHTFMPTGVCPQTCTYARAGTDAYDHAERTYTLVPVNPPTRADLLTPALADLATGPGLATAGEDSPPRRSLLLAPPALRVAIFMVGNRGNGWIEVRRHSRWVERRPDEYFRKVMPGARGVGHRSLACRSEALQCLEACLPDQGIAPPEPVGVGEKGLQRVVDVPWSPFVKKDWARLGACGVAEVRGAGPDKYSEGWPVKFWWIRQLHDGSFLVEFPHKAWKDYCVSIGTFRRKSLTIIWRQWSV
ncbi:hypothetical protein Taro_001668 [Colocasia esculenta]|uniref:Uncharacterized protein n=1 Tax=Colocasia esculenta TaxID=4460 RepID=A0A843TIR3_COLES|nr:hypothetical protein [Colocasia esculenta]